jgi:hypothetical protein
MKPNVKGGVMSHSRKSKALQRLQAQLAAGTKVTKDGVKPLTADDKERIAKEVAVLTERTTTFKDYKNA